MSKKDKKKGTTQGGEVIPTEFEWMTLEKQKENAKKLNEKTKKKKS